MAEKKLFDVRPQLVKSCSSALIKDLLDDLLHENILSDLEVEYINEVFPARADRCRELIDTVKRKGDYSSNVLLQRIIDKDPKLGKELGLTELSLPTPEQKGIDEKPSSPEPPLPIKEEFGIQEPVKPPLPVKETCQQETNGIILCSEAEYRDITTKEKEIYPIREKRNRKRLALIICNIEFEDECIKYRKGANVDLEGMKKLLEELGYTVQCEVNLTAEAMRTTLKTFALKTEHKQSDSTFLVFMSHGERDIIYGTDCTRELVNGQARVTTNSVLHTDYIFETFNNFNCPGLRDKPKVIIIQACRGYGRSQVLVSDGQSQQPSINQKELEDDACRVMLKETDMTCFYASTPDTVSFRCAEKGSLLIQTFIKILQKYAHNSSIEDIFRKVQLSFKDGMQMPTQDRNTFVKKFFLFPGH
ncbi:caspase-1-B-like isoform X2 [Engystomops pustulosus]|uniref:caspase-1-B-like isoform X2 n=1 Tax=Engystomops pustulosus TaxID=76066 RepID=UPI003AFB29FF